MATGLVNPPRHTEHAPLDKREKTQEYFGNRKKDFFWHNYLGAEVDLIEIDDNNVMSAFEFKWKKYQVKTPKNFFDNYGVAVKVVNQKIIWSLFN